MKKNFVLIAALVAALTVVFVSCDDGYGSTVSGTGEATPAVDPIYTVDGMKTGIKVAGSAKFDEVNGIIDFTHTSAGQYDDGSIFWITNKKVDEDSTITVSYLCKVITGTPKFTLKNPDYSDAEAGDKLYQELKVGEVATLELKGAWYEDPTQFAFQRGDDRAAFLLKIVSVKVE